MNTDKLQALEDALAEVFSEPHVTLTNTERSSIFDHAALAEIFSEPLPLSTSTTPSPPSFDHQALAEIFSERPPVSVDPQPSPLGFDTWSSSPPLSGQLDNGEPVAETVAVTPSTNAESARPQRAESLLAKLRYIFSTKADPLSSSSEKDSSPPSLSGQPEKPEPVAKAVPAVSPTDAESARPQQAKSLLTELSPLISTNSELPFLNLEQEPSAPRLSGQRGNVRPAASDVAAISPAGSESARPARATSLVAEAPSLISTKTEPSSPPIFEKNSSPPMVAGRLDNVDPGVKAVAVAAPAGAENARLEKAKSLLSEFRTLISARIELPPIVEKEPSRLTLSGHEGNLEPAVKALSVAPAAETESARAQHAGSLLVEPLPATSSNIELSPPIFGKEPSRSIPSGRQDNVERAEKADGESAQPKQPNSSLTELPPLSSTNAKSPPPISETESSQPMLSGQQDNLEPAAEIVAAASTIETESARPQLAELPPSRSVFEGKPSPTTLSGEPDNAAPAIKTVAAAPPTHALAMESQQATSLPLAVLPPPVSTNKKPSPPIFEEDSPPPFLSGQQDNVEPAAKAVALASPTDAQSTLLTQAKSRQAEKLPPISTNARPSSHVEEAPRPSFYGRLDNVGAAVGALADSLPPITDGAATRAQQAKSLLAELDLNTAIRLRWVMRDIRGNRTATSPASENDLATLIDLGLAEMREELPSLTALGVLALD